MIEVPLIDALIAALERKAEQLRQNSASGYLGDAYGAESAAREGFADWIDELIEQFQKGDIAP